MYFVVRLFLVFVIVWEWGGWEVGVVLNLYFIFFITIPSYLVWCLKMFTNHRSVVTSGGFGEVPSMLMPVSWLPPVAATGSHQSGR